MSAPVLDSAARERTSGVAAREHQLDEPFGRESLETVRGVGYRLRANGRA